MGYHGSGQKGNNAINRGRFLTIRYVYVPSPESLFVEAVKVLSMLMGNTV